MSKLGKCEWQNNTIRNLRKSEHFRNVLLQDIVASRENHPDILGQNLDPAFQVNINYKE